jgi:hypothetical protein
MKTFDLPSSFFLSRITDLADAEHRREMRLLHSSMGGLISVQRAERDASGRFSRRSPSMARSADPQIPLPAEWWNAIFNPGADPS